MTTLDQSATDRPSSAAPAVPPAPSPALPSAPVSSVSPGPSAPPAAGAGGGGTAGGTTRCSIAAATGAEGRTGGTGTLLPGGSVPRPRGAAAGPEGEPREGSGAGADRGNGGTAEGFVRLQQPPAVRDRDIPVLRAAQEELRSVVTRRPSPSRRLRRMHPQAAGAPRPDAARAGQVPAADAASAPGPRTVDERGGERTGERSGGGERAGGAARGDDGGAGQRPPGAEAPLGVLIGGTSARPEEHAAVRATAELLRLGRGTCLVVLPAWRPAIAVSVPTEHLLSATGLAYERLAEARLSVVINPGALHDRELELRDWQAGPTGRSGRRAGRRTS
ncbi:hypothetical protein ACFCX4_30920 [Kitasatospora sp. NPDC056327]|uniref:hypothetical protein n=1 Tax=Kitasatospora sp. NPDC056327 TaxID=3345785 RepID=UPI0035DB3001